MTSGSPDLRVSHLVEGTPAAASPKLSAGKIAAKEEKDEMPWTLRDLFETYGDEIAALVPRFSLSAHGLHHFPTALLRCGGLQELDLSQNCLRTLPTHRIVEKLPKLEVLQLQDNEFQSLDDLQIGLLGTLQHLRSLDISGNPIPSIGSRVVILGMLMPGGAGAAGPPKAASPQDRQELKGKGEVQHEKRSRSGPGGQGQRSPGGQGQRSAIVVKDPKILSSVKTNMVGDTILEEGPYAISEALSDAMGRDVHYCDMNVAPVPRKGPFPMLKEFNTRAISVEDLDLAAAELRWDDWYRKYPRIQSQKRLECAERKNDDDLIAQRLQDRRKKQAEVEMRRFESRMNGRSGHQKVTQKSAKKQNALSKKIAAKRAEQKQKQEQEAIRKAEKKVENSIKALLRTGRLDGGDLDDVDQAWVRVPIPEDAKEKDEELEDLQAMQLLESLKLASLKRDSQGEGSAASTCSSHIQQPDSTVTGGESEADETEDSDEESQMQKDAEVILHLDGPLTIFQEAQKELARTQQLVAQRAKDPALSKGLPPTSLPYKEYKLLLTPDDDDDDGEVKVSRAAAKRVESMKRTLLKKNRVVKPEASFHELLRKSYVKQREMNNQLEDEIQKNQIIDTSGYTFDSNLAERTTKKLEVAIKEFELKAACQFQVKAVKPGWIKNQLSTAGSRSPRPRKYGAVESSILEEHRRHRQRLGCIVAGELPPPRIVTSPSAGQHAMEARSPLAQSKNPTSGSKASAPKILPAFEEIVAPKPGEPTLSDAQLSQNSRKIRRTFVEDLRSLQYKGENFRRDSSQFEKRLQDPMHLMTSYFEHRETSIEKQNVMIDGERFEYSKLFTESTAQAANVKAELKRMYLQTN